MFADLKQHVVRDLEQNSAGPAGFQARVGGTHTPNTNWTPPELLELVPGHGKLPGVSLVWQATANAFQGYYRGAEPRQSTSHSYGGPRTVTDPVLALEQSRK